MYHSLHHERVSTKLFYSYLIPSSSLQNRDMAKPLSACLKKKRNSRGFFQKKSSREILKRCFRQSLQYYNTDRKIPIPAVSDTGYYRLPNNRNFQHLEEIYNIFGRKYLQATEILFCSAFVVLLRETFLFVESTRGGERPTPHTPHAFIYLWSRRATSIQHALSFLSSVMANNNPPPLTITISRSPPLPLPRGTFAEEKRHPSRGGNPYSDDFRNDVIMRDQLGLALDTDELNALHAFYVYPSLSLCSRYISKFNNLGHCRSMLKMGNHEAERAVRGQSLVYLASFRLVNPALNQQG